jgi:Ca2+-binding RTX toxin-like protein
VKEDRRGHLIVDANFIKGCHSRLFEADRVERIDVQLYDGDDFASFHNSVHLPGLIDGGSGDDVLMGGSGNTILVGGDGNDLLIGGRGRNLIIGGLGADLLMAGAGEDILIAGRTAFDANSVALLKIMDEWTSSHDYNTRVKNLRGDDNSGFANRSNGNYFLQARGENRTVFDDKSRDVLVGGSQRDWFFANYNAKEKKKQDLISGWKFFETIENLDS